MRIALRRVALATLALSSCSPAQSAQPLPPMTPRAWRDDLAALARELPKRHASLFQTMTRGGFDSAVTALDRQLDSISADAVVVRLAAIVASVGDGHTRLRLPADYTRVPVALGWFGCIEGSAGPCELRVTAAAPGNERTLGLRVAAIDGTPIDAVHRALTSTVARGETNGNTWALSEQYMQYPNVLHGLGIVRDPSATTFTLADTTGTSIDFRAPGIPRSTAVAAWPTAALAPPISRARPGEPLWFVLLPDSLTVYLSFDSYPDKSAFNKTTKALMAFVDAHRATRLVVDMRRNGGGDFTKVREILLPPIRKHPVIGAKGHLYVLTGPNTFSAAMTNAVDLRKDANAILVGLPTGAVPNGYQEGNAFVLPHSKLVVGYSTKYYKFQERDTPGVIPDQRIEPTWAAFRAGRDPALEWVLARPR
jgi:hypothetical protein